MTSRKLVKRVTFPAQIVRHSNTYYIKLGKTAMNALFPQDGEFFEVTVSRMEETGKSVSYAGTLGPDDFKHVPVSAVEYDIDENGVLKRMYSDE